MKRIILTTVVGLLLGLVGIAPASAVRIEKADRKVDRPIVTYIERVPTEAHPSRTYIELSNGSTWRFRHYGTCMVEDRVPDRACKTVFWYAR